MTLGQILSHIIEKAINVQYQEFQSKLTNQMKEFFFTQTENHLYAQDLNIAKFWKDLTPNGKEKTWTKVSEAQE